MRIPSAASLVRYFALLLGTVGLLWSTQAFSVDPLQWGLPGIPIRQGTHVEWYRAAIRGSGTDQSDGYTMLVWSDTRSGDRDVFAHLVEPDGDFAPGWPINVVNYDFRQEDPEPIPVNGGFIVAWFDFRFDSTGDVYAQKFNMQGVPQWNPEGVVVDTFVRLQNASVNELSLRGVHDGAGGAILAWEDTRRGDPGDIYAQRMLANGTRAWGSPLAVTDNQGEQISITADSDGQGNMICAWVDKRSGVEEDIYAAKIMANGTLPWGGVGGVPVCLASGRQNGAKICPDLTTGGAYFAWNDERTGTSDDLYTQRFSANGTAQWAANGIVLCDAQEDQVGVRIAVSMNSGSQDGVIYCWDDLRVNGTITETYTQKFGPSGVAQWAANGVKVCGDAAGGGHPRDNSRLTSDMQGGSLVCWEDTRASGQTTEYDLYLGRVNSTGAIACGDCGQLVQSGPNQQQEAVLRMNGDGSRANIIYRDYSRGSSTLRVARAQVSDCVTLQGETEVVYGMDGDADKPVSARMFGGNVAVIWEDNRGLGFGTQVYYQVLDTTSEYTFPGILPMNGSPIAPDNNGFSRYVQLVPQVCEDGQSGFFCTFLDNRTGTKQVRLQRVGANGHLACDATAELVDSVETDQSDPLIVSDGGTGCYVVWSGFDQDLVLDVFVMRMDENCEPMWAEPVAMSQNPDDDDALLGAAVDESGCICAVWQTGSFGQYNIGGAKVCPDGSVAWRNLVCGAPREQSDAQVISDGLGGFYFAWADSRDETQNRDIYAQHYNANGEWQWTSANGRLVGSVADQQKKPRLGTDSQHNLYVLWEDFRSGSHLDIYGQKLSPDGARLWTDQVSGRAVCQSAGDQSDIQILREWHDGIYVAWEDRTSSFSDIYGVHIDQSGAITDPWWGNATTPHGGIVNAEYQSQIQPTLAHDYHGGTTAAWIDLRSSGKELLQNIWGNWVNDYTVNVREVPTLLPKTYMLAQNYPNPFNPTTRFRFSLPATEAVKITVFNALGQEVKTLVDEVMHAGTYVVQFDATELSSGTYFYRLETPGFESVKKMQLIK